MRKENYPDKKQALAAATGILKFLLEKTEKTLQEAAEDSENATSYEDFNNRTCRNLKHWRKQKPRCSQFSSYQGLSRYSPQFIDQLQQEAGENQVYFILGTCSTCHKLFERPLTFVEQGRLNDLMHTPLVY